MEVKIIKVPYLWTFDEHPFFTYDLYYKAFKFSYFPKGKGINQPKIST